MSNREQRHQRRTVMVTGAVGGIGQGIVARYLHEGARVALVDLDPVRGEQVVEQLRAQGHSALFVQADVSDFHACARACETIQAEWGFIDTLVNNAGISPKHDGKPAGIHTMEPEEWQRVVGVNMNSVFNLVRLLSPGMIEHKFGRIVSMSSVAGKAWLDIVGVHYSTTKAALIGMTRHLAGELGPHGITVNALAPGRIDTPLLKTVSSQANDLVIAQTPLRRLGTPDEVADACAFLTSDEARFITGQVIDVAGGWLMT
ncbi:MAG: SDR family oxidoreductase [Alcaligenaceae bacterium]|nr:SDR family oxidoreductase [Alcaligenaceae bacterium]